MLVSQSEQKGTSSSQSEELRKLFPFQSEIVGTPGKTSKTCREKYEAAKGCGKKVHS